MDIRKKRSYGIRRPYENIETKKHNVLEHNLLSVFVHVSSSCRQREIDENKHILTHKHFRLFLLRSSLIEF